MTDPMWNAEREAMVSTQLRARGIHDPRVLDAMTRVPRERFLSEGARGRAYTDHALGIGHHQTMSQPYMVAVMTQALNIEGGERILEVGTGSGYQAAVLAEMGASVWTVERIPELARRARRALDALGYGEVRHRVADGTLGWPEEAPFDGILVTAGAPHPPPTLLSQLREDGGRLVAPVGDHDLQHIVCVTRDGNAYTTDEGVGCRFVPLLGAEGWPDDA